VPGPVGHGQPGHHYLGLSGQRPLRTSSRVVLQESRPSFLQLTFDRFLDPLPESADQALRPGVRQQDVPLPLCCDPAVHPRRLLSRSTRFSSGKLYVELYFLFIGRFI